MKLLSRRTSPAVKTQIEVDGIVVTLIQKSVRRITLRVKAPEGAVVLTAPRGLSTRQATKFIREHTEWIAQQQQRIQSAPPGPTASDGDVYWLFAEELQLRITERPGRPEIAVAGSELRLGISPGTTSLQRAAALEDYFRARLSTELEDSVDKYALRMGLRPSAWQIRKMRTRWGSCTHNTKTIRFALALHEVSRACIDYVVVHELAHLAHPNHSPQFWELVELQLPQWRAQRALLRADRKL